MIFSGIQRTSTIDYPAQIAAVLFSPGCNFDCFYCHNRALLSAGAAILSNEEVFDFLKKRQGLLDGIVLSGGEPTLQNDVEEFIDVLKSMNYLVKIDTNGARPAVLKRILPKLDYVAMDYKAPWMQYKEYCGANADEAAVQQSLALLLMSPVPFELRTTVFPQLTLDDLTAMARAVPPLPRYVIKPYKMPQDYRESDIFRLNKTPYTINDLKRFAKSLQQYQPNITVSG